MKRKPGTYKLTLSLPGYETLKEELVIHPVLPKLRTFRLAKTRKAEPPREFTNSIGMKFVRIPAGKFLMGSPEGEGSLRGRGAAA